MDIGAHEGWFTMGLNSVCSVKDALLIEPIEVLAQKLARNPVLSDYSVVDCAISDFDGDIEMKIFPEAPSMSSVLDLDKSVEDYVEAAKTEAICVMRPARKLDTIAAGFGESTIDLIKIDVQGLEHLVIKGGAKTLSRTKAVFTEVSFRPIYVGSSMLFDIAASLRTHGFIMIELEPGFRAKSRELLQADALFVKAADRSEKE